MHIQIFYFFIFYFCISYLRIVILELALYLLGTLFGPRFYSVWTWFWPFLLPTKAKPLVATKRPNPYHQSNEDIEKFCLRVVGYLPWPIFFLEITCIKLSPKTPKYSIGVGVPQRYIHEKHHKYPIGIGVCTTKKASKMPKI